MPEIEHGTLRPIGGPKYWAEGVATPQGPQNSKKKKSYNFLKAMYIVHSAPLNFLKKESDKKNAFNFSKLSAGTTRERKNC